MKVCIRYQIAFSCFAIVFGEKMVSLLISFVSCFPACTSGDSFRQDENAFRICLA